MPLRTPYWSYRNFIFSVKNQGAFALDSAVVMGGDVRNVFTHNKTASTIVAVFVAAFVKCALS